MQKLDNRGPVKRSAWLQHKANAEEAEKKFFDVISAGYDLETERQRKGEGEALLVSCQLAFDEFVFVLLLEQPVQRLSDKMGLIWVYLPDRRTALSHFEMPHPDGGLSSSTRPFLPLHPNKSIPP